MRYRVSSTGTSSSGTTSSPGSASIRFRPLAIAPDSQSKIEVDAYFSPPTDIQKFHKEFPVPHALYVKLKDGLRVWSSSGCARTKGLKHKIKAKDPQRDLVLESLLKARIIEPSPHQKGIPRFCGTFFLVSRPGSKVRPIADFSALTRVIEAPKFTLKSVYQVVNDYNWPNHLWYTKLDLKQAFCNINLHPKTHFMTTFGYGGKFYHFTRMPFGLSITPYIQQSLLNCVLAFIKRHTKYTYGHLDDLIIVHQDRRKLQVLIDVLRAKLRNAGWVINSKKSELNPVKKIKFLGANWDELGIIRDKEATRFTRE
ncbi:Transposon Ty3-I Gag-Pol poly, partial [Brachionus plicatilis]